MKNLFNKLALIVIAVVMMLIIGCSDESPISTQKKIEDKMVDARVSVNYEKKEGFSDDHIAEAIIFDNNDNKKQIVQQDLIVTDSTIEGLINDVIVKTDLYVEILVLNKNGKLEFKGLFEIKSEELDSIIDIHSNLYPIINDSLYDFKNDVIVDDSAFEILADEDVEKKIKEELNKNNMIDINYDDFLNDKILTEEWLESELLEIVEKIDDFIEIEKEKYDWSKDDSTWVENKEEIKDDGIWEDTKEIKK